MSKTSDAIREKYGADYYSRIGSRGGKSGGDRHKSGGAKPKGFAANPDRARAAGAVGGKKSRRGPANKDNA